MTVIRSPIRPVIFSPIRQPTTLYKGGGFEVAMAVFAGQSNADSGTGTPLPDGYELDSRVKIWTASEAWETYNPGVNSGTGTPTNWGPEAAFAKRWRQANPSKTLYILKHAVPATSLATAGGDDWNPANTGENWDDLTDKLVAGLAALRAPPSYVSFQWIQGETDGLVEAYANAYETNLAAFISAVRSEISPDIRFVLARISDSAEWTYGSTVRTAQVAVIAATANSAWVDADDLPLGVDDQHYTNAGIDTLGLELCRAALSGPIDFDATMETAPVAHAATVGDLVGTLVADDIGYREVDFAVSNSGAAETASIGDLVGVLGEF